MDNYAFLGRAPRKEIIVEEAPKTEWERYLAVEEIDISTDLLGWWKSHESEFPTISRMARQVLGCPASSAAVERLFSKATRVYSKLSKKMDGITLRDVLMSENLSFY